jgi:hypothetical protein
LVANVVTTPTDITAAAEDITITDKERAGRIRRFVVRGAVPVESYGELFRCFVGPSARMNLKKLRLGIQFEMETQPNEAFDPNDPALKAMQEAARQLGLTFEAEE